MNKERLVKLAKHLIEGDLGHKKFDFNYFNTNIGSPDPEEREKGLNDTCGYAGCALGECPVVFDEWEFKDGSPYLKNRTNTLESAEEFFEIPYNAVTAMFMPTATGYSSSVLPLNASKDLVAQNILKFVETNSFMTQKEIQEFQLKESSAAN